MIVISNNPMDQMTVCGVRCMDIKPSMKLNVTIVIGQCCERNIYLIPFLIVYRYGYLFSILRSQRKPDSF